VQRSKLPKEKLSAFGVIKYGENRQLKKPEEEKYHMKAERETAVIAETRKYRLKRKRPHGNISSALK